MVLSRRVSRGNRLTVLFYRLSWPSWRSVARRMARGNRRENFLTVYAPLWLLLLIGLWALSMVLAFAMMQWGAGSRMGVCASEKKTGARRRPGLLPSPRSTRV